MNSSVQWVPFCSGDKLPENAIQGCSHKFGADGSALYIGKCASGEIGKINTTAGNTKIKHLWVHGACWNLPFKEGSILVGNPDLVEWRPYSIGAPLPRGAFPGGNEGANHPLYVGRNAAGEVGKITMNTKTDTMKNLWCHYTGNSTSGDILVIRKEDPDFVDDQAKNQSTCCIDASGHDFQFFEFSGEIDGNAKAGQTAENSSSNAFGGGIGGSQSAGARTSAKVSDSTEVGGEVNANFSYNSSQDNKRADQQAAAGQVKGMYAVSAICKKCGKVRTSFPMERMGRMAPER